MRFGAIAQCKRSWVRSRTPKKENEKEISLFGINLETLTGD
jgi:hypothetical protein